MRNFRFFLGMLFLGFLAGLLPACGGSSSTPTVSLVSIVVTPGNPSIPVGVTQQFTATGTYSNGTSSDLTTQVTWNSSNPVVATVNSTGLATGATQGSTTIKAISGPISGSMTLTVTTATLSSISVIPVSSRMPAGITQQWAASGAYNDGTTFDITARVAWSSSNASVATVNSTGLITTVAQGTSTITVAATSGFLSGSLNLTVTSATLSSISVTPANPSIPVGLTQQFTAFGIYSDGSGFDITAQATVTWSSSTPSVATVNSTGVAQAVAAGAATITATSGGVPGSTTFTVTAATLSAVFLTPTNPIVPSGFFQQFTASGAYSDGTTFDITRRVTWTSSNLPTGAVSSRGLAATGVAGSAVITAVSGPDIGATVLSAATTLTVTAPTLSSISVTPVNPSTAPGLTQQFAASGIFFDGISGTSRDISAQVTWTSSNTSVATISSSGLATGVSGGTATIKASLTTSSGTISGSTTLTVTAATLSSIIVTPINPAIPVGLIQEFAASGIYSDGISRDVTAQVTWTSSNTSAVTINSGGTAAALAAGTATITAAVTTPSGTISGSTAITVTPATLSSISVTPALVGMHLGFTQQFTASGAYSDGTSQDITAQVTWTSSNVLAATVSRSGLATAVAGGTATITAASATIAGTASITVR